LIIYIVSIKKEMQRKTVNL